MLSNDVIRKINAQIVIELRKADSIGTDHQEKMEALERIAKLKALLSPQPSAEEIAEHVANFLKTQTVTPSPAEPPTLIEQFFGRHR